MPLGLLRFAFIGNVVALTALFGICAFLAWAGMWFGAAAFAFIGVMIAKPWSLRWPREPIT
jgi:hypothetical protein